MTEKERETTDDLQTRKRGGGEGRKVFDERGDGPDSSRGEVK